MPEHAVSRAAQPTTPDVSGTPSQPPAPAPARMGDGHNWDFSKVPVRADQQDSRAAIQRWLDQHQFASPEQQPDQGERHVLLNGEEMLVSRAAQLAARELGQPPEAVRAVILADLAPPVVITRQTPSLVPSLTTATGAVDPAFGKISELSTVDDWLDEHDFGTPEIRDPRGDRALLDGQEISVEQIADKAMGVLGQYPFVSRAEVLNRIRQQYVAKRSAPSTQLTVGYTLTPAFSQATKPSGPTATQHQFSLTITRAHHAGDSPGFESSLQGSITFDNSGRVLNLQAGGQEALVLPLLRGWMQISGFVQTMASANWNRPATGTTIITPAIQQAVGGQVLATPTFRSGPYRFLSGHVQVGVQATGGVTLGTDPMTGRAVCTKGVSGGLVLNIPFSL